MSTAETLSAETLPAQTLPLEEARLVESRTYPAPAGEWNVDASIYAAAEADPIAFWEDAARRLEWAEPWHTALEWEPPLTDPATGELSVPAARWFAGGRLNVAENCVDRHVRAGNGSKVALHFEGEPGDREAVTYEELQRRVNQAANALADLGVVPGGVHDRRGNPDGRRASVEREVGGRHDGRLNTVAGGRRGSAVGVGARLGQRAAELADERETERGPRCAQRDRGAAVRGLGVLGGNGVRGAHHKGEGARPEALREAAGPCGHVAPIGEKVVRPSDEPGQRLRAVAALDREDALVRRVSRHGRAADPVDGVGRRDEDPAVAQHLRRAGDDLGLRRVLAHLEHGAHARAPSRRRACAGGG